MSIIACLLPLLVGLWVCLLIVMDSMGAPGGCFGTPGLMPVSVVASSLCLESCFGPECKFALLVEGVSSPRPPLGIRGTAVPGGHALQPLGVAHACVQSTPRGTTEGLLLDPQGPKEVHFSARIGQHFF